MFYYPLQLVGTWFPGGGAMGSEGRPAFVPSEICRFLNNTGERLLQQVFPLFVCEMLLLMEINDVVNLVMVVVTCGILHLKHQADVGLFLTRFDLVAVC